jgi:hypothetical protein
MRKALGLALVIHGLGHSVYAARGLGALSESGSLRWLQSLTWGWALLAFVVAGFGVMDFPVFRTVWRFAGATGVVASAAAFFFMPHGDLALGLVFDACALALVLADPWREVRSAWRITSSIIIPIATWRRVAMRLGFVLATVLTLYLFVTALTRRSNMRWGATDEELALALPGDAPGRHPAFEVNHAVTVKAPPRAVWPWLMQLGQDRGGFYSYTSLEDFFLLGIQDSENLRPEWMERPVGSFVRATPPNYLGGVFGPRLGWTVRHVDRPKAYVLQGWGTFALQPHDTEQTRLIIRSRFVDPQTPVWSAACKFLFFDLPHFFFERKMLNGIRRRAEQHHRTHPLPPEPPPEPTPAPVFIGPLPAPPDYNVTQKQ